MNREEVLRGRGCGSTRYEIKRKGLWEHQIGGIKRKGLWEHQV